jgi:hypothetical protein
MSIETPTVEPLNAVGSDGATGRLVLDVLLGGNAGSAAVVSERFLSPPMVVHVSTLDSLKEYLFVNEPGASAFPTLFTLPERVPLVFS